MEKSIIVAGVGGQGILSIAYVIDHAALDAGCEFKQAEIHGMAQRGGAVQSHLRYADHEIHSDLIPTGRTDLVLSVEPLEVLRYWSSLAPDGWVVTSVTPYVNIPDYPELDRLLAKLAEFDKLVMIDTGRLAKTAGSLRAQNMAALGAAAPLLDFSDEELLVHVRRLFSGKGPSVVEVNTRAYHLGRASSLFFRGLREGGMGAVEALKVCQKLASETIDPALAAPWAAAIGDDQRRLAELLASDGNLACDEVTKFVKA
jgi:indolepyruvate ferredoxin oxidoreductase beta subunit